MNEHFNDSKILVAHLKQQLDSAQLLTETELHKLLIEWNDTQRDYPQDKCIHQLFAEQVERTPKAVAVVFEGKQLTYQELNARANQLAHHLQSLGVGPEVLVGICVERSLEMIVGVLGVLKAGGAYVPLDRGYPSERLAYMLEDSSVPVLLTQAHLSEEFSQYSAHTICLDSDWVKIAHQVKSNPTSDVTPDNLAYVIYTSGSTGQPKGVTVPHRAVNRLLLNTNYINLQCQDVVAFASNFSFDAVTFEIWGALLHGAKLVGVCKDVVLSPNDFAQFIQKQEISVLFLTTALFNQMASVVPSAFRSVHHLLFGGEAVEPRWVKEVLKNGPPQRMLHVYGPTESTTFATWYLVQDVAEGDTTIPIGRPISNTRCFLLDAQKQPVPIGVPGELYIDGDGLARGYLNRPDLTLEKFIPNPLSNEPGSRLYKTGDLACYLPDGNIEFLGRIDHQVKIRGFRIELGEIEAALTQHPDVREAVVIVREDIPGDKRLVAYLVENPQSSVLSEQKLIPLLRSFLQAKLPVYMIPDRFVMLDALPLTPNGKVDRSSLPVPDATRPDQAENFVAPSSPTEKILAAIWSEVLGLQQVGINDNFFELGGHSLLATSVVSRIEQAFSIQLPLDYLFTTPTIASVSQYIENSRLIESRSMVIDALPPLVHVPREQHIPLSSAQKSTWESVELNPDSCGYNCPMILHFTIPLSANVLEQSINEIIRRHEILRTNFTIVQGQPQQVVAPSLTVPLEILDLQHLLPVERDAAAQRIFTQQARHKFNLASGSLMKTTLLKLAKEKYQLLVTIHHIITDGWSMGIWLQELEIIYSAFSIGKPSPLPEEPIQYGDFTIWEQQWLNAGLLAKQLAYWQKKLANIPTPLNLLPTKQPQQTTSSQYASLYSLELPESLGIAITSLSRSQGVTNFVIILTALKILLFKLSGQTEIIVTGITANRRTPVVEKMMGCFFNCLYLYSHIDDSQTGQTLLQQVKQTVSEAIAHQDIPVNNVFNNISGLKSLQTTFVSMIPPVSGQGEMFDSEPIALVNQGELWNEEENPLEIYIYSPEADYSIMKILAYYSTNLFTSESIEQFFSDYQNILQRLVENLEIKISEFELFSKKS
ncbi:amino acid adenylation enzyme/thioester reductase family protein [Cylindrospermum stagnale PCC 7417]|uniref:Amino acid adenylation enzyme/thioester reductase family protein n=1 Tax=Cylindrospermum stagnale PCC 7417 TaxID=56107 RepID=K9X7T2_9NOST|nr:non-ribosomal peptide synthetase [Cylindrospermum stagnale]AFZ28126.1 amino acid adenylation enzyme/thioester reductase family protein [Cylindrospermum stagnale PCC 7417]